MPYRTPPRVPCRPVDPAFAGVLRCHVPRPPYLPFLPLPGVPLPFSSLLLLARLDLGGSLRLLCGRRSGRSALLSARTAIMTLARSAMPGGVARSFSKRWK